jgi:hypothetical protein
MDYYKGLGRQDYFLLLVSYGIFLGYAFLGVKVRNLDWTGLSNYLFVVMITMQINTLYYYFWWDVFHHKFTATQVLSS